MNSSTDRLNLLVITEGGAGAEILRILPACGHNVVAVLTSPPGEDQGIGMGTSLWNLAAKHGYATLPSRSVKDPAFAEFLKTSQVDVLLNIHSLYLIRKPILEAVRIGSFNLHPGPLPRYAGLNSPNWAIYRGETHHGVTLHHMEPGIDTGPIAYQSNFPIGNSETGLQVSLRCIREGVAMVETLLSTLKTDPASVPRRSQNLELREYLGAEIPEAGCLTWSRNARQVVDFVRAADYSPFPSPWGYLRATRNEQSIGVLKAAMTGEPTDAPPGTLGAADGRSIRVACGDEWISILKIRVAGKNDDASRTLKAGERLGDGRPDLPVS